MQSWIIRFLPTGTRKHHERSKNINVTTPAKFILSFARSVLTSLVFSCTGVAAVGEDLFNPLKRYRLHDSVWQRNWNWEPICTLVRWSTRVSAPEKIMTSASSLSPRSLAFWLANNVSTSIFIYNQMFSGNVHVATPTRVAFKFHWSQELFGFGTKIHSSLNCS